MRLMSGQNKNRKIRERIMSETNKLFIKYKIFCIEFNYTINLRF